MAWVSRIEQDIAVDVDIFDCLSGWTITGQSLPSSTLMPPLQLSVLHSVGGDSPSWLPLSAPAATPALGTSCESADTNSRLYWNGRGEDLLHVTMALQSYYFWDDNERRHNTVPVILTCELAWAEQSALRCPSCVGCCPSQLCLLSHGLKPAASSELVPWDQVKHSGRQSIQVL